jgi:hypothetical protein
MAMWRNPAVLSSGFVVLGNKISDDRLPGRDLLGRLLNAGD